MVNHWSIQMLDRKRLNFRIFRNIKIIGIIFTCFLKNYKIFLKVSNVIARWESTGDVENYKVGETQ